MPMPTKRPFHNEQYVLSLFSVDIGDLPMTLIAPYGIFPFDTETCLDLIMGDLVIHSILNLKELQKRYSQFGLTMELPRPTQQEMRSYPVAPIAERRRLLKQFRITIGNGKASMEMDLSYLWPLILEFFQEDILIKAQRELLLFMEKIDIPDDKATQFHMSYGNEVELWY